MKGQPDHVLIDYFSRYLEKERLPYISTAGVIGSLKNIFARQDISVILVNGNGRRFAFKAFTETWNFTHVISIPHFPQANEEAVRAVQTAKQVLQQEEAFFVSLPSNCNNIESSQSTYNTTRGRA